MGLSRWLIYGFAAAAAVVATVIVVAMIETGRRVTALEAQSQTVETRHGTLEYEIWGEGPPVLVIHSAGGGFDQGRLVAETMVGGGFTWISVSRFGYLQSDLPDDSSTAAQAEAFADALDRIGVNRVGILAISGGAPPALKFAEMFPGRTDRLALLAPAPFTPFGPDIEKRPVPGWAYSALLGNDVIYWVLTKIARRPLATAFDARPELREGLPHAEEAFVERLIDGFLPASRRLAGVENEGAAVDPRARYDLETITAPVLIVHARDDRINPVAIGEALARRLPFAELAVMENGGHLLLGRHETLKARLSAFLTGRERDD